MRKTLACICLCVFALFACEAVIPDATPTRGVAPITPRPTTASTTPLYTIPAAAWSRGIGVPYNEPIKAKTFYPMTDDGAWGGVPLGGLGAGAIGRTYRGDFARWHLDLGIHQFGTVPADQFSVFVAQGTNKQAHVLSALQPEAMTDWNWDMPAGAGTYYGLFPKAWFVYNWDALPVNLAQKQFSPVIPGNYQESSYPVGVFEWKVQNPTDAPITVGLMFSWQNLVGQLWDQDVSGNYNYAVNQDGLTGVVLTRQGNTATEEWDGSFAILAPQQPGLTVTYQTRFSAVDDKTVWADFSADGQLDNTDDQTPSSGEQIAAAVAATVELAPGETRTIPFTLAWDFPITQFDSGTQWYKRYTKFYGVTGRQAQIIAADALKQYPQWEAAIDAWQQPILDDANRPTWYKTALFNELYYLVDGGTVWENGRVGQAPPADGVGGFAYLECFDYPFYNTFDVNFYASFALAQLWPDLEKRIMRDFGATVPINDPETFIVGASGETAPRKLPGKIPHDLGSPLEDPWLKINAYTWQNINIWKDLNSKFVLQLWRDYVFTGDETLVHDLWPYAVQALADLHASDTDGDGLPDHAGVPDQTYDTWPMTGASAYGGSLWLAALEAAIEMGNMENDTANVALYTEWLTTGKASFEAKLWNGSYYDYDSSQGDYSDSIMADQLAGQWYADATGLPPIVPEAHLQTALQTVYANNVLKFESGQMGAVNGMRPDGTVDTSGEQAQEVWSGVTYALAAAMLERGQTEAGWATAYGAYNVTYNRGYWFRTPEAWDRTGNFRASIYMRPLSVWAIERALRATKP